VRAARSDEAARQIPPPQGHRVEELNRPGSAGGYLV